MGQILDTNDEVLGLELKRESFGVLDLRRTTPERTAKDKYSVERTLKGDRYEYAVCYAESQYRTPKTWFTTDNEYAANRACTALNMLEAANEPHQRTSEHIFAYADGEIEVTKEFLRKLVEFFDDPENRKMLEE